jgi:Bacterial SH3 domain
MGATHGSAMMKIIWLGIFVSLGMVAMARAQSGSTGGSIGNDEKALSGTRPQLQSAGPDRDSDICVVADPTGTPLNIRTSPNGKIVGKIANGERVRISEQTTEDGKQWAYISNTASRPMGWVFRKFLSCR